MDNKMWLVFAVCAGLCWGTYVPFVQQGIRGLGNNAYGSFLCVGVAYFLIAVLFPIVLFWTGERQPAWNVNGISFATLAGVAGALGALFVIYANRAARAAGPDADYRLYIAPVIFATAPVINTLVSLVWHPAKGAFHFALEHSPHWTLYLGILLTGAGAALVLYSKEKTEELGKQGAAARAPAVTAQGNPPGGTP
jgi:drug/metabolite transporter (DMT)-like permease